MTHEKKYDVVALSAICVDIQIMAEESVLKRHKIQKGFTNSVSAKTLARIMEGTQGLKTTGSPGVNVAAGIALRGGVSGLIGKIANDDHGKFFADRAKGHGIDYTPVISTQEKTVTTCAVIVTTPDKERSFAFLSGAGLELAPEDVDHALIAKAKITYLDSYLWLSPSGKDSVHHAAEHAKKAGSRVAIALNDANVVERNSVAFLALARSHGDILLGDQREFMKLFGTKTLEETVNAIHKLGCIAAITAGKDGAHVVHGGTVTHIPANKIANIVDTNGAGDQFAAGFLYGLAQGKTPADAARQGAAWASDIIQHMGAEPKVGKNAPTVTPVPARRPAP
jgi:sugar/nucleoside kinase (ribokinase family)